MSRSESPRPSASPASGRGGAVEHAISGIDIALWDLMGKACGQPVSRLLGGNYRETIKPYGSILFDEPEPLRLTLISVMERGFQAIKLGWRPFGRRDRKFDELLVRTARATVGDHVELMVDAGRREKGSSLNSAFLTPKPPVSSVYVRVLGSSGDTIHNSTELVLVSPELPGTARPTLRRRRQVQTSAIQRPAHVSVRAVTQSCQG